jgi:cell division protein FtsB
MSERSAAPRPGGRAAQSRTTRRSSRDAETTKGGARGTRQPEKADTRRSGIRSRGAQDPVAPVDGATALSIEVTGDPAPIPGRLRLWVAPPIPVRAPRAAFATAIVAVVLIGVVGILLINTKTVEQSFRLDALRTEKATLDQRQHELERQIVDASKPGALHAAARRLGLVQAEEPAVIWLPNGEIIRPPAPGKGPTSPTADDGLRETGAPSTAAER